MVKKRTFSPVLAVAILYFTNSAYALTPQVEGLAGAGRAGLAKESLFSNPAAVSLLQQNTAFGSFTETKIRDLGAGGRALSAGLYDGSSRYAHGGLGYIRESRRISLGGSSTYADSTTFRAVVGRELFSGLQMGVKTSYSIQRQAGVTKKFFHGDVGFIYPLFTDLPLGITVENVMDKLEESPRRVFLAARYDVDGPLDFYGDIGRSVSDRKLNGSPWAFGIEVKVFDELFMRGGFFRDTIRGTRGWATGLSWMSPRAAFEYALKKSTSLPRQTDHTFGLSLVF